jgi:hypothetical protein
VEQGGPIIPMPRLLESLPLQSGLRGEPLPRVEAGELARAATSKSCSWSSAAPLRVTNARRMATTRELGKGRASDMPNNEEPAQRANLPAIWSLRPPSEYQFVAFPVQLKPLCAHQAAESTKGAPDRNQPRRSAVTCP